MPAIKSKDHVHMYERVGKRGHDKIWRCADPDCTHTIKKELVLGKRSRCSCGDTFIIDHGAMQRKTPKCLRCRNTAEGRKFQKISNVLDNVIGDDDSNVKDALREIRRPD